MILIFFNKYKEWFFFLNKKVVSTFYLDIILELQNQRIKPEKSLLFFGDVLVKAILSNCGGRKRGGAVLVVCRPHASSTANREPLESWNSLQV